MFDRRLRVNWVLFGYGGVEPATYVAAVDELAAQATNGVAYVHDLVWQDALISRSRSRAASAFLADRSKGDVLAFVDHDVAWATGDLAYVAKKAHREDAWVAGLYSVRAFGKGTSSRGVSQGTVFYPGGDRLFEAKYLATGFMAMSRKSLEKVVAGLESHPDKDGLGMQKFSDGTSEAWWDIFRPFVWEGSYLSEDYAACQRAEVAGVPRWISERPTLLHYGNHGYSVADSVRKLE